jgi:hypothetical protein
MLTAWAHRVGGEQYRRARYCDPALMRERFAEGVEPELDPVDRMLHNLQRIGRRREMLVLVVDTLLSGLPEAARMQWLHSMGVEISRKTYYVDLSAASLFVLGYLMSQPAANDDCDLQSVVDNFRPLARSAITKMAGNLQTRQEIDDSEKDGEP